MSRIDDGSDELNAAANAIRAESREQIAERLEAWERDGVQIGWEDFPERAVLERAARLLREATTEKSSAVGNAAKLREAVGYILKYADSLACRAHDEHTRHYIDQIRNWAQSVLAAPARNCDAGTAMEQTLRFRAFCERHGECMGEDRPCPLLLTPGLCDLIWAQMPYEEGGAK